MRLDGKVALVTGAAMGIGRGIALLFAREGAKVAVVDYDQSGGEDIAATIQATGGSATFVKADVADPVAVQGMVAATKAAYGRIDILVNNAGIDLPQATNVVDTTIEDWDRTLNVNLRGVFLCCKYALPEILEQGGGAIINIASIAGLRPMPQEAAYGASKGGLALLTRQMARDYARHGIRVNSVCPGPMEKPTRHRQAFLEGDEEALMKRQAFADAMPLGRMCLPEDIAQAALFLASDEASMITGVELVVDGGFILG